jgi:hypothetical protein
MRLATISRAVETPSTFPLEAIRVGDFFQNAHALDGHELRITGPGSYDV